MKTVVEDCHTRALISSRRGKDVMFGVRGGNGEKKEWFLIWDLLALISPCALALASQ